MKYQLLLVAVAIPEYTRLPPTVGVPDPRFERSIVSAIQPTSDLPTITPAVADSAPTPEVSHNMSRRDPRKPWLRRGLGYTCTPEVLPNPPQPASDTLLIQRHLATHDLMETDLPITLNMMTISNDPFTKLMVSGDLLRKREKNEKCRLNIG